MADGSSLPHTMDAVTRLAALPRHIASYIDVLVERERGPMSATRLDALIGHACASLGASPADFSHLSLADRAAMERALNENALESPRDRRCRVSCSAALRRRIRQAGRLSADPAGARASLWRALLRAVALSREPMGDTTGRTGEARAHGWQIAYRIDYVAAAGPLAPLIPWNEDLVRRTLSLCLPLTKGATQHNQEISDGPPA